MNLLRAAQTNLEVRFAPELSPLVHWQGNQEVPVHRWYKYREGFSPELIQQLSLGQRILDPFAGSGSIMVGAAETNRQSVGIDVSPLATFITRVKTTPLAHSQIESIVKFLHNQNKMLSYEPWPVPSLRIAYKLFEPTILTTILKIRRALEEWTTDEDVRNFLKLAWISNLETVGSYFKEGNGIKYRNKKRNRTGYTIRPEGEWQLQRFGQNQQLFALESFVSHLRQMVTDAQIVWTNGAQWTPQEVHTGSAMKIMPNLMSDSFDSAVFSPPYANRFDYFEAAKVEMWFGDFITNYDDLNSLRKTSMRSHLGSNLARVNYESDTLEQLISLMDPNSYATKTRIPDLLRGYFEDMHIVLKECRRVTKKHARTYVVVGNSAYAGVIIPTDSLCAQIALQSGYNHARLSVVRHLTVAPQQREQLSGYESFMRESIIELW